MPALASRHGPQTPRTRPHRPDQRQARPLPAARRPSRVPGESLTDPNYVQLTRHDPGPRPPPEPRPQHNSRRNIRRQAPRGRDGPLGMGPARPVARDPRELPVGALLCVIHGPSAGRRWEASAARKQLHHATAAADVRRRFAPHQLRHAHAVEMPHEGVPLVVIQRQLGHANLGITSIYLQGIDSSEIIGTVHGRPSPTISASAGLQMRR
jgi:hypothetical protein